MKYRLSFDLDLSQISPETASASDAEAAITSLLIEAARDHHKATFEALRHDQRISYDEKTRAMATHLGGITATLMAEANMSVEALPAGATIKMEMPFEKGQTR